MKRREGGFTLVELLTAMALAAILMTLGALAIRQFWFARTLSGGQDELATQLRRQQQRVIAETHPLVYGARFFPGEERFGLVRWDPDAGTCVQYERVAMGRSLEVAAANFASSDTEAVCAPVLQDPAGAGVPNATTSEYVFFFARGNATPGSVTIRSRDLDRQATVQVAGITGRVTEG